MLITHVGRSVPQVNAWIPVSFVTKDEDGDEFYLGFNRSRPYTKEAVEENVRIGFIVAVDPPQTIEQTKTPWLSNEGDVWLTNTKSAVKDPDKVLLIKGMQKPATKDAQA